MADNQIVSSMGNSPESPKGTLSFSNDVLAKVAGLAVQSVDGVTGVSANLGESISGIINKNDAKKGIRISTEDNKVTIGVGIIVKYGSSLIDVAKAVQDEVKSSVEKMTGAEVAAVNVTVAGLSFPQPEKETAGDGNPAPAENPQY